MVVCYWTWRWHYSVYADYGRSVASDFRLIHLFLNAINSIHFKQQ